MRRRNWITIGLAVVLVVGGGASAAHAYSYPSLTSLYTQVAYLGFQVQNLLRSDATQSQQIQALQMQNAAQQALIDQLITGLAAEVTARTNADTNLQSQITAEVTARTNADTNLQNQITTHVNDTGNAHQHDARYVRDSGENLRVIRGAVDGAGTIIFGDGFTVNKTGTGTYQIVFDTPFSGDPAGVATVFNDPGADEFIVKSDESVSSVVFTTLDGTGTAADLPEGFDFLVVGPQ